MLLGDCNPHLSVILEVYHEGAILHEQKKHYIFLWFSFSWQHTTLAVNFASLSECSFSGKRVSEIKYLGLYHLPYAESLPPQMVCQMPSPRNTTELLPSNHEAD